MGIVYEANRRIHLPEVRELEIILKDTRKEYLLLPEQAMPGQEFLFLAKAPLAFENRGEVQKPVSSETRVWHAHLLTLNAYNTLPRYSEGKPINKQFMDVQAIQRDCYHVTLALDVPKLEPRHLHMTVVMLRQYRNLKLGRHSWSAE